MLLGFKAHKVYCKQIELNSKWCVMWFSFYASDIWENFVKFFVVLNQIKFGMIYWYLTLLWSHLHSPVWSVLFCFILFFLNSIHVSLYCLVFLFYHVFCLLCVVCVFMCKTVEKCYTNKFLLYSYYSYFSIIIQYFRAVFPCLSFVYVFCFLFFYFSFSSLFIAMLCAVSLVSITGSPSPSIPY